jgi:hypothetical protein
MSNSAELPKEKPEEAKQIIRKANRHFATIKDYTTFVISLAAFGISVFTFYSTQRTVDQIGLIIAADVPQLNINKEGEFTIVKTDGTLTFVNSGTRHAAIVAASLLIEQPQKAEWRQCNREASTIINFVFEPVVLKPNEVVARSVRLKDNQVKQIPFKPSQQPFTLLCLEFDLTTPEELFINIRRQYMLEDWPMNANGKRDNNFLRYLNGNRLTLIDSTKN